MKELLSWALRWAKYILIPIWLFIGLMAIIGILSFFGKGVITYILSALVIYLVHDLLKDIMSVTKEDIEESWKEKEK